MPAGPDPEAMVTTGLADPSMAETMLEPPSTTRISLLDGSYTMPSGWVPTSIVPTSSSFELEITETLFELPSAT